MKLTIDAGTLKKDDVLATGEVVVSPVVEHDTYVSVVARHPNGVLSLRDWDKGTEVSATREIAGAA